MSRLILHIGTHKTATTSIQHYLSTHHAALAARGVFYPGYDLIGKKPHYAHLGMANALVGQHKNYTPAEARRFFGAVRQRMADHDITVLSAEPLYRHVMPDSPGGAPDGQDDGEAAVRLGGPAAYWPARMRFIEHIHDLLGPAEVVVVFRRQADYAQSLYQEHIKVTSYARPFAEFLKDFWFHFAFLQQAQAWDRVFPGLRALRFDKMVASGDAVAEFCRLVGLPVEGLPPALRHNEAMPADLVILKRIMQGSSSRDEAARRIGQIEPLLSQDMLQNLEPRSFFDSAAARQAWQQGFDSDNAALRPFFVPEHADPGPAGEGPVFPASFRPGGHFGDSPHPRVMAAVLRLAAGTASSTLGPSTLGPALAPALAARIQPTRRRAEGTPLELTVLGDGHARFFLPTKDCSLVRCGYAGGRLKITDHAAPLATITALPGIASLDSQTAALRQAAAKAQFLCLAYGQTDLELGHYATRLAAPAAAESPAGADTGGTPAGAVSGGTPAGAGPGVPPDFAADLLARYEAFVLGLGVDPAHLALKAVNLTLLRERRFILRSLSRALGQGKTDLKARLEPLVIGEKEQNALARAFNTGLKDIAARHGFGYLDLNPVLAQPGVPPRLAAQHRPAGLTLALADTVGMRALHIQSLLEVFGADPAHYRL